MLRQTHSWEGFALECVCRSIGKRDQEFFFWNTHAGAELDLFWQEAGKNWGIEFKYVDAPVLTKSMKIAKNDLDLAHLWIVYPGGDLYKLDETITVLPIKDVPEKWNYKSGLQQPARKAAERKGRK